MTLAHYLKSNIGLQISSVVMACLFAQSAITDENLPTLKLVKTALLPIYEYGNESRQDVSASALGNGIVLLGDDGGPNSDFQEIRITSVDDLSKPALLLKRQVRQKDIEGMTFYKDAFYVTSSMSQLTEDSDDFLVLSEIKIDPATKKVTSERYVNMREKIIVSLRDHFKNQAWYGRISTSFAKEGGLNVEGLSVSHLQSGGLVFGLRSPLWGEQFGSSKFGNQFGLAKGSALLVHVKDPFAAAPEFVVDSVDLEGKGIRSLEYIPNLGGGGYLIVAGPVEKDGSAFQLWWYQPGKSPNKLNVESFAKLCRPESIMVDQLKRHISILSEQSGDACLKQAFTYIDFSY